jgi:hypothetical protein
MRDKVPGWPVPSKGRWQKMKQEMNKGQIQAAAKKVRQCKMAEVGRTGEIR